MQRLGDFFARLARWLLPDPMVLACGLTLLVIAAAIAFPQEQALAPQSLASRCADVAGIWLAAVWNPAFLTFALQMCLILLTGFGLARAPLALRGLRAIARVPSTNRGAVFLVAFVSCVGCWINWGLGLIFAGLLATQVRRELSGKGKACQYALVVAAAYTGMMIWHGGFSGSAPLKVASDAGFEIEAPTAGGVTAEHVGAIPIERTILAPANLGLAVVLFAGVPLLLRLMARRRAPSNEEAADGTDPIAGAAAEFATRSEGATTGGRSLADWLNHSRALPTIVGAMILLVLVRRLSEIGTAAIDLNFVNSFFLGAGLLLHHDLLSYIAAVAEGGRAIVGIVLQFPLYSGIQGVMFTTGLAAAISQWFVHLSQSGAEALGVSTATTFPIATLASAGIVNFFVPSGGGQWIVQGPIMCGAAHALALPYNQTVMAIAYGDQLTNMVQPFWAIPLMGMTKVNARQFMGYSALLMILSIPVFAAALLFY